MTFVKGKSGNPLGRKLDNKPFAEALKMELAAAGENHKKLREIAKNLIDIAAKPGEAALPAIQQVADRLDGKPAQESNVTIEKRDATDWSFRELVDDLRNEAAEEKRVSAQSGSAGEPDIVH